jgi:hypothetical protein
MRGCRSARWVRGGAVGAFLSLALALVGVGCGVPPEVGESSLTTKSQALSSKPRRVHVMHTSNEVSAASAPSGAHLAYFGGRVVSNLQVVQVIYGTGSYIPQVTSTASPSMATFYQGVLNSPYVDWLTEYDTNTQPAPESNQIIGRGAFVSQVVITPSAANNGATIDDTNIQAELALQIQAGALPAPTHDAAGNNNTYYDVFFPHGKQLTIEGIASCSEFCAYHGTIANAGGQGEVYYGVHPDFQSGSGCEFGCGAAPTVFGNYSQVASHEMTETITDAEVGLTTTIGPPLAWYDTTFGEVGDICNDMHGTIVGGDGVTYDVQTEFSNIANDCIVSRIVTPTLTVNPATFEGGTSATGTVSLGGLAPAGGASVALVSSVPGLVTVPATVSIPAGNLSATFAVTSVQTSVQTGVTITATFPSATASATLTVLASPTVSSLALSPASVVGGTSSTGTVTLDGAAPAGGALVTLASANTAVATVSASVLVPAGSSVGTFTITTALQSATTQATISASFHNTTATAVLTVTGVAGLSTITVSPTSVDGGNTATGTVTLTNAAPSGGAIVILASSNSAVASVPASVTVASGLTSATFAIATTAVSAQTVVTLSGTYPTGLTKSATLTLSPPGNAVFDATLKVPRCAAVGSFCDTGGTLIRGRANITNGPELNTPNTLNPACPDGPSGTFHSDESLDRLRIATVDGTPLAAGKLVEVDATVWVFDSLDFLDVFFAPDATNPVWTLIATVPTTVSQQQIVLSTQFSLPAATVPAIRAGWRFQGTASTCTTGAFDDRDDLVFAVAGGPPVNQPPVVSAGPDQAVTLPALANLTGTVTDDGLPGPPAVFTTTWSVVGGPGTVTFGNPSALLTTAAFSMAGSYTLRLTANDGQLSASDDLVVTVGAGPPVNQPPVVNAGPDQTITLPAAVSLSGTVSDDGLPGPPALFTTTWSVVSGPGAVTFANASAVLTTATFAVAGAYTLRLTANDSLLSASDDIVVTVNLPPPVNQPPTVNAGPDQSITFVGPPLTANLSGTFSDDGLPNPPGLITTTWTVVSGPGTVTFSDVHDAVSLATFSAVGSYDLRLTASDGALSTSDDVVVTVNLLAPVNQPPSVNAGPDQTITLPATASLAGTASDDGLPNPPATLTTTWSKVSGPGTVTFGNASAKTTTATFSTSGSYVLRLTASDSALSANDTIAITVNPVPVNTAPVVNAGADQTITLPAVASLVGTVTDDGRPNPPGAVTTTWSKVSGPGTVTFGNASAKSTTATFSTSGSYVLRLTASDSALSASDTIAITVNPVPANTAPVVSAGPDLTITLPATAALNGTVTDDGRPNPPGLVTTTWSKVSGPGTVTFANANVKATTATFSVAGTYVVRLTASDSALSASDTAQIIVNAAGTSTPCSSLCSNPINFTVGGSFQSGNLGTAAVCYQTTSVVHGGNCNNFVSPRSLTINGTTEPCNNGNWASVPAAKNGGYCVQTTAGNQSFASFTAF